MFWSALYFAGAAQALLLAIANRRRRKQSGADRVLVIWLLVVALDLAIRAGYYAFGSGSVFHPANRLASFIPFLHAAAFYLYVVKLTTGAALRRRDWVHTSGFWLALALNADLFWQPYEYRALRVQLTFEWGLMLFAVTYLACAIWRVVRYRQQVLDRRSDVSARALRWLVVISGFQLAIWLTAAVSTRFDASWLPSASIYAWVAIWVFAVNYLSLTLPPLPVVPVSSAPPDDADDDRLSAVMDAIQMQFAQHDLHLKPALTIGELSQRVGYPEYLVSLAINRRAGERFGHFVNRQRVAAAVTRFTTHPAARLIDTAYAVGFTAKSTFNDAFKRVHGTTPSAYRAQLATQQRPD